MNDDQVKDWENPYVSPTSAGPPGAASAEGVETEELRAFVGPNAGYYLSRWRPLLQGRQGGAGFNGAAFLLSGLWLGYRKMYKVTAIFLGIILVESLLEDIFFVGVLGEPETPLALSSIVGLVAGIICGVYGNRWYLSHARKVIAEVRAEGLQGEALMQRIARRGGTSVGASLGMFLLFVVIMFVFLAVLGLLYYPA